MRKARSKFARDLRILSVAKPPLESAAAAKRRCATPSEACGTVRHDFEVRSSYIDRAAEILAALFIVTSVSAEVTLT
jgi:hypothetical protein